MSELLININLGLEASIQKRRRLTEVPKRFQSRRWRRIEVGVITAEYPGPLYDVQVGDRAEPWSKVAPIDLDVRLYVGSQVVLGFLESNPDVPFILCRSDTIAVSKARSVAVQPVRGLIPIPFWTMNSANRRRSSSLDANPGTIVAGLTSVAFQKGNHHMPRFAYPYLFWRDTSTLEVSVPVTIPGNSGSASAWVSLDRVARYNISTSALTFHSESLDGGYFGVREILLDPNGLDVFVLLQGAVSTTTHKFGPITPTTGRIALDWIPTANMAVRRLNNLALGTSIWTSDLTDAGEQAIPGPGLARYGDQICNLMAKYVGPHTDLYLMCHDIGSGTEDVKVKLPYSTLTPTWGDIQGYWATGYSVVSGPTWYSDAPGAFIGTDDDTIPKSIDSLPSNPSLDPQQLDPAYPKCDCQYSPEPVVLRDDGHRRVGWPLGNTGALPQAGNIGGTRTYEGALDRPSGAMRLLVPNSFGSGFTVATPGSGMSDPNNRSVVRGDPVFKAHGAGIDVGGQDASLRTWFHWADKGDNGIHLPAFHNSNQIKAFDFLGTPVWSRLGSSSFVSVTEAERTFQLWTPFASDDDFLFCAVLTFGWRTWEQPQEAGVDNAVGAFTIHHGAATDQQLHYVKLNAETGATVIEKRLNDSPLVVTEHVKTGLYYSGVTFDPNVDDYEYIWATGVYVVNGIITSPNFTLPGPVYVQSTQWATQAIPVSQDRPTLWHPTKGIVSGTGTRLYFAPWGNPKPSTYVERRAENDWDDSSQSLSDLDPRYEDHNIACLDADTLEVLWIHSILASETDTTIRCSNLVETSDPDGDNARLWLHYKVASAGKGYLREIDALTGELVNETEFVGTLTHLGNSNCYGETVVGGPEELWGLGGNLGFLIVDNPGSSTSRLKRVWTS